MTITDADFEEWGGNETGRQIAAAVLAVIAQVTGEMYVWERDHQYEVWRLVAGVTNAAREINYPVN